MVILAKNLQSNYDLCLQGYGSLDNLVKMCRDNGIVDINQPKHQQYIFDESFIVNRNYVGYEYATLSTSNVVGVEEVFAIDANGNIYISYDGYSYILS
jgi:hypothetical protein